LPLCRARPPPMQNDGESGPVAMSHLPGQAEAPTGGPMFATHTPGTGEITIRSLQKIVNSVEAFVFASTVSHTAYALNGGEVRHCGSQLGSFWGGYPFNPGPTSATGQPKPAKCSDRQGPDTQLAAFGCGWVGWVGGWVDWVGGWWGVWGGWWVEWVGRVGGWVGRWVGGGLLQSLQKSRGVRSRPCWNVPWPPGIAQTSQNDDPRSANKSCT